MRLRTATTSSERCCITPRVVASYKCDVVRVTRATHPVVIIHTPPLPSSRQLSQAKHAENKPGPKEQRVKCLTGRVKPWTKNTDFGQNCRPAPLFTGHGQPDSARYTEQYRDRGSPRLIQRELAGLFFVLKRRTVWNGNRLRQRRMASKWLFVAQEEGWQLRYLMNNHLSEKVGMWWCRAWAGLVVVRIRLCIGKKISRLTGCLSQNRQHERPLEEKRSNRQRHNTLK